MSLRERSAGGAAAVVEAGEDAAATLAEPDGPDRCLSLLPWDRFSAWLHCVCVVGFDLELGQAVESFPLCFCAFDGELHLQHLLVMSSGHSRSSQEWDWCSFQFGFL